MSGGGEEHIGIWTLSEPRDRAPRLIEAGNVESFAWAGDNRLLISSIGFGIMSSGNMIAYGLQPPYLKLRSRRRQGDPARPIARACSPT